MTDSARETIVFVHSSDELYGADRVLLEIVLGLPARYRAVVVLPRDVSYSGELTAALVDAGADVEHIHMAILRRAYLRPTQALQFIGRFIRGTVSLLMLARRERAALIHTNTVAAVCGPAAAFISGRPHVWDIHENLTDEPRGMVSLVRALVSLIPGIVLANSRSSARSIVAGDRRRARKTKVVYYGVVVPEDRREYDERELVDSGGALPIAFLGRLTTRKGIEQALEAIARLHRSGVALTFDVYGDVPPHEGSIHNPYTARAVQLGIGDIVRFHGFVPDARSRLKPGGVLLVPSQRPEPFGLVVVEGMLARQVVIACRNGGGSDEIIHDGVTGLYCARDSEAIASAIISIASDAQRRLQIGCAAREAAIERYSIPRFQAEMTAIYDWLREPIVR